MYRNTLKKSTASEMEIAFTGGSALLHPGDTHNTTDRLMRMNSSPVGTSVDSKEPCMICKKLRY